MSRTKGAAVAASKDPRGREFARRLGVVQQVCERLEAGESLSSVCRDPLMPQRSSLERWLEYEPALAELVGAARARARASGRWPRRDGHAWSDALAEEVLARIAAGRSLVEVCAEPDMPHHVTVTRWLKERPDFRDAYLDARLAQADALFDLAWKIARDAAEDEWRTARLKIDTIKWRIGKLAPRRYGPAFAVRAAEAEAPAGRDEPFEAWVRHFACGDDPHDVDFALRAEPPRRPDEPLLLWYDDGDAPEPPRHPSHIPPPAFREAWEIEKYGPGPYGAARSEPDGVRPEHGDGHDQGEAQAQQREGEGEDVDVHGALLGLAGPVMRRAATKDV